MSLFNRRFYLILHICIGIIILINEYFYRWIIQTYKIYIHQCSNEILIEFKQLYNIQSLNWFEKKLNYLMELFSLINNQCLIKEFNLNLNPIFTFLRYLWLTISSIYVCLSLKYIIQPKNYQKISYYKKNKN